MLFLRLNINDSYNNDMGYVDVSDQRRNYYCFDLWLRKQKWWWSIMQWGIGVLLVNAYTVYKKVMEESDIPKQDWLTQYEFRHAIAMAWISPEILIQEETDHQQVLHRQQVEVLKLKSKKEVKTTTSIDLQEYQL
jgi:hypothetical protein